MSGDKKDISSKESSRSWFCVLNNPGKIFGESLSPEEMVERAINMWIKDKPQRTCAVNYEIGDSGTPHMHMVLEDPAKSRFSAVQKLFPGIHIESTKGSKGAAEDYINKVGRFKEKGHTVIVPAVYHGEIKANSGVRNDLDVIQDLLEQGKTPNEILDTSIQFQKYEAVIKKRFFRMKKKEMPRYKDMKVYWHTGDSGTGKTYTYIQLCEKYGDDNVYLLNDYENGGFDNYSAEEILFMEEYKEQYKFATFLSLLDGYIIQVHCRYSNCLALWHEVHVASIFPPEKAYKFMVEKAKRNDDKIEQLKRRITTVVYHYKQNGEYKTYEMPIEEYQDIYQLRQIALSSDESGLVKTDTTKEYITMKINEKGDHRNEIETSNTEIPKSRKNL